MQTIKQADSHIPKMTVEEHEKFIRDLNPEKILEVDKEKATEELYKSLSNERAAKEPIPGIAGEIFDTDDIIVQTSVGKVRIRKMVAKDVQIFKWLDSPFYKLMMGDIVNDQKSIMSDEEDIFLFVYQFTHDVRDIAKSIKEDIDGFCNRALDEIGFTYSIKDVMDLSTAIMQHMSLVNNAKVDVTAKSFDEGNVDIDGKKKLT